ncbi:MAG: endonuclease III [bacterium]|nr:endonuclease III [bacterium]
MVRNDNIDNIFHILNGEVKQWKVPAVTLISRKRGPFQVLISCIISLRTKDEVTGKASRKLYALADCPEKLSRLSEDQIADAIYPAGFYRQKAKQILAISKDLLSNYDSVVPDNIEELLKFKGVGRKTANLVLTLGYGKPGICVDIHVHRITNRWGYVDTKTPDATEVALRQKLPKKYWIPINDILVTFGQNICTPLSPHCSKCKLHTYCKRSGVEKSR